MKQLIRRIFSKKTAFNSGDYWENRYAQGGNSGDGSYGQLADFKADFINAFIKENDINTAIEFGCGDGHQLSLIQYPQYLGLDVSESIIRKCKDKFKDDKSRSFIQYDTNALFYSQFIKAELSLSLDVIYHIVEENTYEKYLQDLFGTSNKYVIIYSTNFDKVETMHVVNREFIKYVQQNLPDFELLKEAKNPYAGIGKQKSNANFFIFKRS